jgi:hypothetical protein
MLRLTLRSVVASTLLGAAAIHAAQAPSHLAEWWAAGIAFMVMAAVQALLGAAALRTDRWLWQLAQAVSLATLGLWVLSRTVGLPVGPEAGLPEPVGRAESDVDRLRQAGYTDEDILQIAELTAIFNYNGRLANGLGLVANQQYHELGRAPRASDERQGR